MLARVTLVFVSGSFIVCACISNYVKAWLDYTRLLCSPKMSIGFLAQCIVTLPLVKSSQSLTVELLVETTCLFFPFIFQVPVLLYSLGYGSFCFITFQWTDSLWLLFRLSLNTLGTFEMFVSRAATTCIARSSISYMTYHNDFNHGIFPYITHKNKKSWNANYQNFMINYLAAMWTKNIQRKFT